MKFLADMGVSQRVVEWLKEEGHEAIHLREQNLHRLTDSAIFEKAIAEKRIILTFDLDFVEIIASSKGRDVSVILFKLHNARSLNVIARLKNVLKESGDALNKGAVIVVEESRHRLRYLPIGIEGVDF